MSETGSNFAMPAHDLPTLLRKAGSCGLPLMTVETKIVDDDGNEVPTGERGELWVRGPCVAHGYWKQPDLTAKAFVDGWFVTGDAAMRDEDGFFYIVDRKKDLIIVGGVNVFPQDIEDLVSQVEGVRAGRVSAFSNFDPRVQTEQVIILAESDQAGDAA